MDSQIPFHMKPYHVTLEEGAEPVIHPLRSVPVHLRDLYKQEIDPMLEAGVIALVDGHTHRLGEQHSLV